MDWKLEPLFGSYWTAILLCLGLLITWYFIREDRELSRGQRLGIKLLRLSMVLILILAILRPGAIFTRKSEPRGAIAVMVDVSQSAELPSGVDRKSRWQVETELWNKLVQSQSKLGNESPLVIYGYDDKLRRIQGDSNNQVTIAPNGSFTDVGKTLSELIAAQVDPPLNAVIWMGDATQTILPGTVDPQQMARQLAQLDIPLMMFGLGPRGDVENIKDIAIEGVPEQLTVFSSNPTQILGLVSAKAMLNKSVPIQLFMKIPGQPPKMIAEDVIQPDKLDQTIPFRLAFTAPEAGSYELEVVAKGDNDELSQLNNRALCFLNVSEGGSRVLYLEGEPRWEQRYLNRSLDASPDFDVDFQWVQKREWPKDITAQLAAADYDAYILGDLDATALTADSWKLLAARVNEGAGLITLGGFQTYGPGGYGESALASILPIEMDGRFRQKPGTPIQPAFHFPSEANIALRPTGEAIGAGAITSLAPDAENLKLWIKLPPMKGANKWGRIKEGAGVRVILESAPNRDVPLAAPMAIASNAGKGRVVCFAFDTTYQWVMQGFGDQHKKFWRQAVLWTMRRENPEEGLEIELDRRRFYREQDSNLTLRWNPGMSQLPIPADTKVRLLRDGKEIRFLDIKRQDDRTMIGKIIAPAEPGRYELFATCKSSEGKPLEAKLPFIVLEQSVESLHPVPDWALMNQMAQLNDSAGGCLLAPEELDDAIDKLVERRKTATLELVESYKLGDGNVDSWILFVSFIGLLTLQWRLRKKWGLA